jgi:hypothetical protein
MGGVERREKWKETKYIPRRRRIRDIYYAPGVDKK